jgi:hypothetical protein
MESNNIGDILISLKLSNEIQIKFRFVAQIKNPDKRFGMQLGSLSGGRINIANHTTVILLQIIKLQIYIPYLNSFLFPRQL